MKPSTREWVKKAEADYQLALALSRRRKVTFHDHACFACQQSAEKYLKARLEEAGIVSPKTHDLKLLLKLVAPVEPLWSAFLSIPRRFPSMRCVFGILVTRQLPHRQKGRSRTPLRSAKKRVRAWGCAVSSKLAPGTKTPWGRAAHGRGRQPRWFCRCQNRCGLSNSAAYVLLDSCKHSWKNLAATRAGGFGT